LDVSIAAVFEWREVYKKKDIINLREKIMQEITVQELKEKMDAGEDIELIDVRQPDEYQKAKIEGAKLIPLPEIIQRMDEIDNSKPIVVHCKMGGRSAKAIEFLQAAGFEGDMSNLVGGITAWSDQIDPSVPKYH
jgi:adenylyltransferase/sulfurtransferase